MELVIASRNIHKIREFKAMLKEHPRLDILSLLDFPSYQPLKEGGATFEENACAKALHAAKSLQKLVLADDSGLVVPALNGAPGIYSARYAGENATDADNRKRLIHDMQQISESHRQGYFECWLAVANVEGLVKSVRGLSEGTILLQEKGSKGFGYDALFMKHEYSKSFGEMEEDLKNRISHRRKALDKLHTYLSSLV
jgi:XTP/dITP diphosphohydrolase